jgi:hypothetical protein
MNSEYVGLLLFAAVNMAALFYRRAFSYGALVYLATLILLYAACLCLVGFLYTALHFWWNDLDTAATLLYCFASAYCIIKEKRIVLLPFVFANLFLCHVVIYHTTGGTADLTLSMLFYHYYDDIRVMNTVSDTGGIALVFMGIGVPVFLLVQLIAYIIAKKEHKKYDGSG